VKNHFCYYEVIAIFVQVTYTNKHICKNTFKNNSRFYKSLKLQVLRSEKERNVEFQLKVTQSTHTLKGNKNDKYLQYGPHSHPSGIN